MIIILSIILSLLTLVYNQAPSGKNIVTSSIEFHDPNKSWQSLQAHLSFIETRPNKENRTTSIGIDNKRGVFCANQEITTTYVQRHIKNDSCFYTISGSKEPTSKEIEEYKLTNERSFFIRNYYLYLWGLPMKLKDAGTQIDENARLTKFDNKDAYEVKVWYDKKTGSDTWYFYFNPKTFALIGYKFYHDEANNDGEYIVLKDSEIVFGMQVPKSRSWYTNSDSTFLGTDILASVENLDHDH